MTDHARIAHDVITGINEVMIEAAHGNYDNDEMNVIALGALAKATIATTHALLAINDALQQRNTAPRGACPATRFEAITNTAGASYPCIYDDGHTGMHRHTNGGTRNDNTDEPACGQPAGPQLFPGDAHTCPLPYGHDGPHRDQNGTPW